MDIKYYEELIKNMNNAEKEAIDEEKESIDEETVWNYIKVIESGGEFFSGSDKARSFLDYISLNDKQLEFIMNKDSISLHKMLCYSKPLYLGNNERYNKIYFPINNFPIIRIMDYCLKHGYFEHFSVCTERLEAWAMDAYWNARHDLIEETINNYRNNPDFFFMFDNVKASIVKKYITLSDIPNLTYRTAKMLISKNILPEYFINTDEFLSVFKTFTFEEQIYITELLVGYEFDSAIITKLHSLFNKEDIEKIEDRKEWELLLNIFEISPYYLTRITDQIKRSSYFKKFNVEKSEFWLFVTELLTGDGLKHIDRIDDNLYAKLMDLYQKCYNYATESIVSSLYPLSELKDDITYIDKDKYNLLCRVQTLFDLDDLDESFRKRTFCGFSVLNQDNFSHYPGGLVYGYYSKLTPDMIAHIFPTDSLSASWALYKKDLSLKINMLLDIDDLNAMTYENKTYNQLCIRTKTNDNEILREDAIICFDNVDDYALWYQEKHNSKILVLRRNENTIEYNEDIYSDLQ